MAVSVDTVYQRVLAILNKEQRGYVTPQEFNLFANQAQLDIFEQYFYDINQFGRLPGNDTEFSDMLNILNEKINLFETNENMVYVNGYWQTPANVYRQGSIVYKNTTTGFTLNPSATTTIDTFIECERINFKEWLYINQSDYTKPTNTRPIFVASDNGAGATLGYGDTGYKIYGNAEIIDTNPPTIIDLVSCNYIKVPAKVNWGYQMVYNEALYNAATSTDFELHESEETELVIKILEFAGLSIKSIEMYQIANQMEQQTIQQEKA